MLLHSHHGELHVLPALPPAWPTGSVTGLRGRGGYTVGAAWSSTRTDVTITPDRAGPVRVRSRIFTGPFDLGDETSGVAVPPTRLETDVVEFTGQAGHTYRATATQSGPVVTGVNYRLVAQHSGKAADIDGASATAGAPLIQWRTADAPHQQFDFLPADGGHHRIRARHSGLVLQVAGTATGADITQQPDTNAAAQQWRVEDQGGGVVRLLNRVSGLAMDVWQAATTDGARISQWTPGSGTNQRFLPQRV